MHHDRPDSGSPPAGRRFGAVSDYSRIADQYDATRTMPANRLAVCYDRLIAHAGFPAQGRILDAGCGTGQISLPLAARGYAVTGLDMSAAMIALAQAKRRPSWNAHYVVGDVRAIPMSDHRSDGAVVSKLYQHIEDRACMPGIDPDRPAGKLHRPDQRTRCARQRGSTPLRTPV